MTIQEQAVLSANEAFYLAFSNQDISGMEELWSANHDIAVIHPGWPALLGHHTVLSSWKRILEGGMSPNISCVDARANVLGDAAVVICTELLAEVEFVATNIFVLEHGDWKMIHHQAGPLPTSNSNAEGDTLH